MTYEISYNIPDNCTLDGFYNNADVLRKYPEKKDLNNRKLQKYLETIPASLWPQFEITTYGEIEADGDPEIISSINAAEWINE